jgi:PAS domain S-box-containing protein
MRSGNVLFIGSSNTVRSQIAEAFARVLSPSTVGVFSAGTREAGVIAPVVRQVVRELGGTMERQEPGGIASVADRRFDLIVSMDKTVAAECPILPGAPAHVRWQVEEVLLDKVAEDEALERLRTTARRIKEMVRPLMAHGYLEALVEQKERMQNILGSLTEGVLAHDMNRRIFYFNRGAERLTGLSEAEVLGRDCHEVFSTRICGENCSFCDGYVQDTEPDTQYSTVVFDKNGSRHELDIALTPMRDSEDRQAGVVASLTDRTDVRLLERRLGDRMEFCNIIGQDHKMQQIYDLIADLGPSDFPVLVQGESGTGKELVANAIHLQSLRKDNLFVPINCGALPEGTLESELFGHVKGAFTGAIRDKKGRFELANGGTVFLDEVAELSPLMQVKLLRVLQEGTFEPVGSEKTLQVDVRIISATNKNLRKMMQEGAFREDLYYRLAVVPVELPPLRDRRNDIPLLANRFLAEVSTKLNRNGVGFSSESMSVLTAYTWPGNVRQLQNAIQYSMIKCHTKTVLPDHFPPEVTGPIRIVSSGEARVSEPGKPGRKPKLSAEAVEMVLRRTDGNKAKAARMLGVGRATLYNFLKSFPHLDEIGSAG